MRASILVLAAVLLSILATPAMAVCECEGAPCEEVSLQSVAARDPESTGFGVEMAPVTLRREPTGMTIEINSASSHSDAAFGVLVFLCAPFVPIISLVRRLLSSTGPLIEMKIDRPGSAEAAALAGEGDKPTRRVARVSPLGDRALVLVPARVR